MVSLKDIAGKLGVGVSTVSAVLNGKDYCYVSEAKKQLIKKTAGEMGYVPNQMSRGMQGLSTKTIGIIGSLFSVPVMSALVEAMNKSIAQSGYSTMLGDSHSIKEEEGRIINEFLARGVDGVLVNSVHSKKELERLLRNRLSYVSFNKDFDGLSVAMDRKAGAEMAVDHLISAHGRERVAFVAKGVKTNPMKLAGYRETLEKHQVKFDDGLCLETDQFNNFSEVARLLVELKVDAVLGSNDIVAGMLIKSLTTLGKQVPEDVAVIGFDGIEEVCSLTTPILTSIKDPVAKVADKAVDLLLRRMNGEKMADAPLLVEPEWLHGESCGCTLKD